MLRLTLQMTKLILLNWPWACNSPSRMEPDNLLLCHWAAFRGSCIQSPGYYIPPNYTV